MSTDTPTTFSGKEMLGFHRFRLAEQVDEWVTDAVANLTAAKKLCEELERKNMVKTVRQREALAAVSRVIQCALEAGHVPMLQYSSDLFSDFAGAFEEEEGEGDDS